MSYYFSVAVQNTRTKAPYKRKCLVGLMVSQVGVHGGKA